MIFPVATQVQENGCIAVLVKSSRWSNGPLHPVLDSRPRVDYEGQKWQGPRLSYHLNKHQILCSPPSLKTGLALHSCDNEWCVNDEHISLGDCSRNQKEACQRTPAAREARVKGGKSLWERMTSEERKSLAAKKSETMKKVLAEKRRLKNV